MILIFDQITVKYVFAFLLPHLWGIRWEPLLKCSHLHKFIYKASSPLPQAVPMYQKRNTNRNPILPLKSKGIIPVFELIPVSHIDLYNQWCAKCLRKDVKWLYATQINHSFSWELFDVMRLYKVITFVICLGFFTIRVWHTVWKYLWKSASTTVRWKPLPIFDVSKRHAELKGNGRWMYTNGFGLKKRGLIVRFPCTQWNLAAWQICERFGEFTRSI